MRDSPLQVGDLRERAAGRWRWGEVLLLTAAVPFAAVALGGSDPFLLAGAFPWLVIAPMVIGVQHGLWCALASVSLLSLGASVDAAWSGVAAPSPALGVAAGVIAGVAGRACDAGREKAERLRARLRQLEAATAKEKAARQVLELSHARLLQKLAGTSRGLQAAVDRAVSQVRAAADMSAFGRLLLELLAEHAQLEGGVVYAVNEYGGVVEPAVARFGEGEERERLPSSGGLLVERALRMRRIVSVVDIDDARDGAHGGVLAALPLLAADAKVLGVLALTRQPFAAFHPASLREAYVMVSRLSAEVEREQRERWMGQGRRGRVSGDVAGRVRTRWGFIG